MNNCQFYSTIKILKLIQKSLSLLSKQLTHTPKVIYNLLVLDLIRSLAARI